MRPDLLARFFMAAVALTLFCVAPRAAPAQTGKPPVIIIPGITGSKLVDVETGKTLWFTLSFSRGEPDDLRLPMSLSLSANRDNVVAKDIIRDVKLPGVLRVFPDIHVYDEALKAFTAAGYSEAKWDNPKASDCFYVFAYDWRRDNVESARLLLERIEEVKAKLKLPHLKFNVVAHSMGGLIARYAAMYGKTDLPAGNKAPAPNWAGARHIGKLLLFGTPSEGSFSAFAVLMHGYKVGGRLLPFINHLTEDDVFTIPSLYQLLPYGASFRAFDEDLKPIDLDPYNPETWRKFGWGAIGSHKFLSKLKNAAQIKNVEAVKGANTGAVDDRIHAETTYEQANDYLAAVLLRALKFHQALDAQTLKPPVEVLLYGGNCSETLSAIVVVRDAKKGLWETVTSPRDVHTSSGRKIPEESIRAVIHSPGDGRVTERSLLAGLAVSQTKGGGSDSRVRSPFFACASHPKLLDSSELREKFLPVLGKR